MTQAILKRRYRTMEARPAMFVDLKARTMVMEEGPIQPFSKDLGVLLPLRDVLRVAASRTDVVYIVGGWNADSSPKTEWFAAPDDWQRVSYNRNPFIAVYKRDGARVTIYGTGQWFGDCADLATVRAAYVRLLKQLRSSFGASVRLMGTPARTGLDLIERSLPTDKNEVPYEWPVLADDVRNVIEHTIGQGRMEMLPQSEKTPQVEQVFLLDAIWMYASCVRRLPSSPVVYDTIAELAGYRQAFYHVKFQVPSDWSHIGLLPTWNPKAHKSVWPADPQRARDAWFDSYVCGDELRFALEHGWPVEIKERWLFAEGDNPQQDPLRNWIEKLRALRDQQQNDAIGDLCKRAIRAICIKAIGGLHRRGRFQQVETPVEDADSIPEDAEIIWRTETHFRWKKPIPLHRDMAHFQHPEWSAMIWGRARAKLAKAALLLPRETIIALRSDAIVCTFNPGWAGTKPGEFRVKEEIWLAPGQSLPRTTREYLDLLKRNDSVEEDEEE